jgi:uncharacterized protein DUF1553/uncharacterized protein DUF1549/cytochrome c/F5/8 type C domain-containing protein
MKRRRVAQSFVVMLSTAAAAALLGAGGGDGAANAVDFARDVRPIFEERCTKCHGGDKPKSGFRLDARRIALRGGNSGDPAIVPGHPEQSRLVALIHGEKVEGGDALVMPPKGERLDDATIGKIEQWIRQGAPWPDELAGDELIHEHWSFVPPRRPSLPDVKRTAWPRNAADYFVLAKLEANGLDPSPEAGRATLARRVALDLTGLPPALAEVDAFVADGEPQAYERYVRSMLAKPSFGERWARPWLDLARYADSMGYGSDPLRPWMWRWRDWVIDAFNRNMPFDQFTIEQLAGDLLPNPTNDQLLATAFHRNTMCNTEGGTDDEEFRVAAVKDRVDSTLQIWMGLTAGCAKCHSHKFDPIPQKDYYRLFAIFNQSEDADRADDEPRVATPTAEQAEQRARLVSQRDEIARRRAAAAGGLAAAQASWEQELAASEQRWHVLRPDAVASSGGTEFDVTPDGVIVAKGPSPETDKYVIDAASGAGELTAIRLEALADPSLPNGGPGRSAGNGNFVLNDLRVAVAPAADRGAAPIRWVRIENPGAQRILSLAEVEVFAGADDLARRGHATQSSVDYDGPAERAIDGNTNGEFQNRSVTHTRQGPDPWWELDLGANARVDRIVVWNRTDGGLQSRLAGMHVQLFADAQGHRALAWESTFREAPDPSLEFRPGDPQWIDLVNASADFEQERFAVAKAIDASGAAESGWAIAPARGRSHVAVFEFSRPVAAASVHIELSQSWGAQHTLGRFRLSVASGAKPPRVPPEAVLAALQRKAPRDPGDAKLVADYYTSIAPELEPFNKEARANEQALAALDAEIVRTPIMRELPSDKRRTSHVLIKSNYLSPGALVQPDTPRAFPPLPANVAHDRLALARWLVSRDNPLTARVAVNRFWAQLFGRGIVETEEDFGTQGTPPTHPELLDWLAVDFMEKGFDVKELLLQMVTSATYRQTSRASAAVLEKDPRDTWLGRFPRRRLEAEMVRDQALALSGLLSPKIHGPSVYPPQPDGLWQAAFNGERTYPTSTGPDRWRRGIYTFWRRTVPPPSMQTFDAPSREVCTIRRQSTDTPLQAFVTLNDPVYVEAAQAFARRIVREGGATPESRASFALRLALARTPEAEQVAVLTGLHAKEFERYRADPDAARKLATSEMLPPIDPADAPELAAWTAVANVVLNLDAVLTRS